MSTQVQPSTISLAPRPAVSGRPKRTAAYVGGIVGLALAYYGAAKIGQSLRYTASVAAMWPPAGVGIAALYLWGLRWWPGVLLGDLVVNAEQHFSDPAIPLGSLLGQQTGNMAEIVLGAALLTRLIGRRAALDQVDQVIGMLAALAAAAATSATVGTVSMLAGGVVDGADAATFWRTWWLGDLSGALVVVATALAWSAAPAAAWCRLRTREGALMIAAVVLLGVLAVTIEEPVTYVVFPALIWAALRFGPPGAALAMMIASGLAIGITAAEVGPFAKQTIDHRTLATQLFIAVTSLTTLILSAVVCERERSAKALSEAKLREGERAVAERQRIARELHDSVSQALFSTLLHTRMAQRSLRAEGAEPSSPPAQALNTIADLTREAQSEMRALISELGRDPLAGGLVPALERHVAKVIAQDKLAVRLDLPRDHPALEIRTESHLFGIAREGLANAVKHAEATQAWISLRDFSGRLVLEIGDDGRGFDPAASHPEHFGLESMRTRAAEIDARLTIASAPGEGTVVRAELASPRVG
ncbi:MAG TPA: MASE1 domain-containing protein [Solirubrobacter sp.]